jgi:hypothetical protein
VSLTTFGFALGVIVLLLCESMPAKGATTVEPKYSLTLLLAAMNWVNRRLKHCRTTLSRSFPGCHA